MIAISVEHSGYSSRRQSAAQCDVEIISFAARKISPSRRTFGP
jgi:hypothetical protein